MRRSFSREDTVSVIDKAPDSVYYSFSRKDYRVARIPWWFADGQTISSRVNAPWSNHVTLSRGAGGHLTVSRGGGGGGGNGGGET